MSPGLLLTILLNVAMGAGAQVLLKAGMSSARIQGLLAAQDYSGLAFAVLTEIRVLLGLLLYGVGAFVWLLILARVDLSKAYPFIGVGFILTMFSGSLFFNEPVGVARIVGTLLVVGGVVLVARS